MSAKRRDDLAPSENGHPLATPLDELASLAYGELQRLARYYMRRSRPDDSLRPTALVHEAYIRLARARRLVVHDRTHFLALAAGAMRRIVVERNRAAYALKRGAKPMRVTLTSDLNATRGDITDVLAVDEALTSLERRSPRRARVAELRLFAGLEMSEIAEVVGVTTRTVKSDWKVAKARLGQALRRRSRGGARPGACS